MAFLYCPDCHKITESLDEPHRDWVHDVIYVTYWCKECFPHGRKTWHDMKGDKTHETH